MILERSSFEFPNFFLSSKDFQKKGLKANMPYSFIWLPLHVHCVRRESLLYLRMCSLQWKEIFRLSFFCVPKRNLLFTRCSFLTFPTETSYYTDIFFHPYRFNSNRPRHGSCNNPKRYSIRKKCHFDMRLRAGR